jgi:glucosamine--fructose-6-phosphate aminotransferase (isomerizing)
MCGIFGYVGSRTAEPILLDGLRTLEYRGYDSAGIFVPGYGAVKVTHGAPTEANAHPHQDMSEEVWLVHNGIIENYQELKEGLLAQGVRFHSDTDTEVLAKLVGSLYTGDLRAAVQRALDLVRGTYGVAVMTASDPDTIVVARLGSPIVLGVGTDGHFVSSDPSALLAHTKDVVYLEDGEVAVITKDAYEVISQAGEATTKEPEKIEWNVEAVQKQGYEHFMLKEIMEAPEVIENTIRGRLLTEKGKAKLGGLEGVLSTLSAMKRLQIVGCGSAYYASAVGRYLLEEYANLPVEIELASEYRYKNSVPDTDSAILAVSQSGETADTLASIRKGKELDLLTMGVVNVVGSTIARETDVGIYNHAGPEVAVASTKAFISQLTVFVLLTLLIGRERGMSQAEGIEIATALMSLPETIARMLADTSTIESLAKQYADYRNAIFIGRKFHAPIAFEGALKLKEVAYTHAEAYAGGELKHGPIAMLDEQFPIIALVPQDDVYEKMISNIEEVRARQAPVLAIATEGDTKISEITSDVLYVPKVHPAVQPIISTIPLHLLAYHIGIHKGYNVDRPRNLAKSVTVE